MYTLTAHEESPLLCAYLISWQKLNLIQSEVPAVNQWISRKVRLESEYHRSPHRGLQGATPLETWLARSHLIVPLDPTVDLAEAFRHQATRKVHRDSTVTLDGVLFELPSTLIGERVVLRYDPTLPPANRRLLVRHRARIVGEARLVDSYANARVRRADLRLDPSDDDAPDAAGAPAARSAPPDQPLPPAAASLAASRVAVNPSTDRSQEQSR